MKKQRTYGTTRVSLSPWNKAVYTRKRSNSVGRVPVNWFWLKSLLNFFKKGYYEQSKKEKERKKKLNSYSNVNAVSWANCDGRVELNLLPDSTLRINESIQIIIIKIILSQLAMNVIAQMQKRLLSMSLRYYCLDMKI